MMAKRRWNDDEIDRLKKMRADGVGYDKIAAELGRAKAAVQVKMSQLRHPRGRFLQTLSASPPTQTAEFAQWLSDGLRYGYATPSVSDKSGFSIDITWPKN